MLSVYFLLQIFSHIIWISTSPLFRPSRDSILLDYTNYNTYEPHGDGTYSFGYEIEDPQSHNIQFRDEERTPNGTIVGSYGWVKPDGNIIMVRYVADEKGYRANVETSEGQIKFYGQPTPTYIDQSTRSPAMLQALMSQQYSQQNIQDQYFRPIDRYYLNKNEDQFLPAGSFSTDEQIGNNKIVDNIFNPKDGLRKRHFAYLLRS